MHALALQSRQFNIHKFCSEILTTPPFSLAKQEIQPKSEGGGDELLHTLLLFISAAPPSLSPAENACSKLPPHLL